jgi:hypothetical protein
MVDPNDRTANALGDSSARSCLLLLLLLSLLSSLLLPFPLSLFAPRGRSVV